MMTRGNSISEVLTGAKVELTVARPQAAYRDERIETCASRVLPPAQCGGESAENQSPLHSGKPIKREETTRAGRRRQSTRTALESSAKKSCGRTTDSVKKWQAFDATAQE
jgi:hypothetical protein